MTATTAEPEVVVVAPTTFWTRSRKAGVIYLALGLVAIVFWGDPVRTRRRRPVHRWARVVRLVRTDPVPGRRDRRSALS